LGFSLEQAKLVEAGLERPQARHVQALRGLEMIGGSVAVGATRLSRSATVVSRREAPAAGRSARSRRLTAHESAASHPEADVIELARSFAHRAVEAWWGRLAGKAGGAHSLRACECALGDLPETLLERAEVAGRAAAKLPVDEAAYRLGLAYTSMLPAEYRVRHGVHFTPPALAERMLDQATDAGIDWVKARVLDPACGGGAFLAPVVRRIVAALEGCDPAILIGNIGSRVRGYEIDPFAAWLSQVALDAVLLPAAMPAGRQLPRVVTVCDTLEIEEPEPGFDLVIGNPPYGRVRLSDARRRRFSRALYGHANLYALFMDIAIRHTRPNGLLAYLTPTSFLAGEYFKRLRKLLAKEARPVALDFVAVRKGVFDGVLQEVLLALYRRGSRRRTATVSMAKPEADTQLKIRRIGTFRLPADASQPWLMPRSEEEAALIETLSGLPCRMADWGFTISTGPLVWNRHKSQLAHQPGPNTLPLIWAEAVTRDGRFVWRADKRNHAPYFEIGPNDDWLIARHPCILLQRTTAKEQARRLIAAALPQAFLARHKAAVIENHLNMIRPTNGASRVTADVVAAFLNSQAADRAFRCISGSVAVSAYELEALPLPSPDGLKPLAKLVSTGAGQAEIEVACTRLLNPARLL
jgi:adenine-specific DNA-methyltransferase